MRGEVVGVFGIFFVGEPGGLGNVAEGIAAENVTIRFRADAIIAVIGAGNGDLIEEGGIVQLVVYVVVHVKDVIQIRTYGNVIDGDQVVGAGVADDFFGERVVVKVFDLAEIRLIIEYFNVIGFRKEEEAAVLVGDGVKIRVCLDIGVAIIRIGACSGYGDGGESVKKRGVVEGGRQKRSVAADRKRPNKEI